MASDWAIETDGLAKTFHSRWSSREVRAVDGISLRVERGTTYGLLGPNGAGKTTFVKMLLSSIHPTAGAAKIFGRDTHIPDARRPIGYLPENHRFPTYLTGASMLDFYGALSGLDGSVRRSRIPKLLDMVGLFRWGGVRLGKYSKGMLQRIGLAQALMHEPALLLLDEPGDGVDPIGRREIRDILRSLEEKGVTIFLNSHLLVEVELFCSQVAIIHRGKLALEGKVRELTSGSGYRVEAAEVSERLIDQFRAQGNSVASRNGLVEFHFPSRDQANAAVDLLRAERCPIESVARTTSTLEDVFVRTINAE
ncbi:MAG: ABC transporter ATP-binding protein [Bryobacteraceae bacterium]